jgi:hypothetical protein
VREALGLNLCVHRGFDFSPGAPLYTWRPIYIRAFHIASISINSLENDSATQFKKKKKIIANSCTQLSVSLLYDARNVFSLFLMKYKGSRPLN